MNMKLCSSAMLAAVCFASNAQAGVAFRFDPTGQSGANGFISVETFDWSPDNALSIGAFSTAPGADGSIDVTTVAQARLTQFINSSNDDNCATNIAFCAGFYSREFTFQTSFLEKIIGVGSANTNMTLATSRGSYYRIYADTAKDANVTTGNGYGNGTLIFEAVITALAGTFHDASRDTPATPIQLLDRNGADNQNGVRSHQGTGNNTLDMSVTFLDTRFFLDQVANGNDTTNLRTSFNQVNPSNAVVGVTPAYSRDGTLKDNGAIDPTNPAVCAPNHPIGRTELNVNVARCDFHIQTDGSLSFSRLVPEPTSLTLGLLGFGLLARNLRRRAV
ncbi:MAG: PEP-CTERM sorting domain-containing protein [Rhodocyclaceae bacterium]|nr:PEP-CTERM sorting domain-containing protein [Rhodocyclaceae bacterium]MBX3669258.1 PEP-CTERM sorting domain-containing protein [Rhodocyclaceae bacterium]